MRNLEVDHCVFCSQAAPLDICFDSFYTSRKEMIDKRLEEILAAPVEVDRFYSFHCFIYLVVVTQIHGTDYSCVLIFLLSETSANAHQDMGGS